MEHIRGMDRNQVILFPEVIDDYITEENSVRFIDAFVDSLDRRTVVERSHIRIYQNN